MDLKQITLIIKIKHLRKITAILPNETYVDTFLNQLKSEDFIEFGDIIFKASDFMYAIIKNK